MRPKAQNAKGKGGGPGGPQNEDDGSEGLRPAADLTAERKAREGVTGEDMMSIARAIRDIENAHRNNLNTVTDLAFTDWTVAKLLAQGYSVTPLPKSGPNGEDQHRIDWP
jgi:hypothetical protein